MLLGSWPFVCKIGVSLDSHTPLAGVCAEVGPDASAALASNEDSAKLQGKIVYGLNIPSIRQNLHSHQRDFNHDRLSASIQT